VRIDKMKASLKRNFKKLVRDNIPHIQKVHRKPLRVTESSVTKMKIKNAEEKD
jgi:hypothetical protein